MGQIYSRSEIGVERDGAIQMPQRFFELTLVKQRNTDIAVHSGMIWTECAGTPAGRECSSVRPASRHISPRFAWQSATSRSMVIARRRYTIA